MKNIELGYNLRAQITKRQLNVDPSPGVYRWWFPEKVAKTILQPFNTKLDTQKIQKRTINGETYWALYFGISCNMKRRCRWHINGPFKCSTLRRTLHSILQKDENRVNALLDQCYWEWDYTNNRCDAEKIECDELSNKDILYPLNIDKNIVAPKDWLSELKGMRKNIKQFAN